MRTEKAQQGDSPAAAVVSTVASGPPAEATVAEATEQTPAPYDAMNPMDDPPPAKTPAPTVGTASGNNAGASTELGPGLHDFTLPNAQGGPAIQLSSYLGKKNVVMVFYRAFW